MKDILNQFIADKQGQFIEVSDKSNIYQCMDLDFDFLTALRIPKSTIGHLYASQVYTAATDFTRTYFDIIPNTNTFIPQDGDLTVFSNLVTIDGKKVDVGHIGIAIGGGTTKTFKNFEQNWPLGSNAHIVDRNYDSPKLLGVLRPKNVIIDGVPSWLTTLLAEQKLTTANESEIRIIFDKAKKYTDDVANLQEQVKSANESLADKSLEVSDLTGKNQTLSNKVDDLNKLYNDTKTDRDTIKYENNGLNAQVEKLTGDNTDLQKGITDRDTTITGLKSDLAIAEKATVSDLGFWTLISFAFASIGKKKGSE